MAEEEHSKEQGMLVSYVLICPDPFHHIKLHLFMAFANINEDSS